MEKIRLRCRFAKEGPARFLGHLDLVRTMTRAWRRAGFDLALTEGFHPHPQLSFAAPLPVGVKSRVEVMEVVLAGTSPLIEPEEVLRRVNCVLPPGLALLAVRRPSPGTPSPMAQVVAASYQARLAPVDDLLTKVAAWKKEKKILVTRVKPGERETPGENQEKILDLKPLILSLTVMSEKPPVLELLLRAGSRGNARPEEVLAALRLGRAVGLERTGLFQETAGRLLPLE